MSEQDSPAPANRRFVFTPVEHDPFEELEREMAALLGRESIHDAPAPPPPSDDALTSFLQAMGENIQAGTHVPPVSAIRRAEAQANRPRVSIASTAALPRSSSSEDEILDSFRKKHGLEDEKKFLDEMFGEGRHKNGAVEKVQSGHGDLSRGGNNAWVVKADLVDHHGRMLGNITRQILPGEGKAYHSFFQIEKGNNQGQGLGKEILGRQIKLYKKLGLKKVELLANIDVGGYAWSRYGFVPKNRHMWEKVKDEVLDRLISKVKGVPRHVGEDLLKLLESDDPKAIWDIAGDKTPVRTRVEEYDSDDNLVLGLEKEIPLGKALLLGQQWGGKLDLDDKEQMDRFNDYVSSGSGSSGKKGKGDA